MNGTQKSERNEVVPQLPEQIRHANQQTELSYVVRGKVASGYLTPSDLLTRVGEKSDFATDVCVYKNGIDPATGERYLEEIAFEVVSTQTERDVTEKAKEMTEDDCSRGKEEVQTLLKRYEDRIQEMADKKSKEIMEQ